MKSFCDTILDDYREHYLSFFSEHPIYENTSICMDREDTVKINNIFGGIDNYLSWNSLPYRKQGNALKGFSCNSSDYIGIFDESLFKSCKCGILIARDGLYIKGFLEKPVFIDFMTFCMSKLEDSASSYSKFDNWHGCITLYVAQDYFLEFERFRKYLYNKYEDIYPHYRHFLKDMIIKAVSFDGLGCYYHVKKLIEQVSPDLNEIANALEIFYYIYNADFDSARKVLKTENNSKTFSWIDDKINIYEDIYNNEQYSRCINKAEQAVQANDYETAILYYESSIKFKDTAKAYTSILEYLYICASSSNKYNTEQYCYWMQIFKEKYNTVIEESTMQKYTEYQNILCRKYDDLKQDLKTIVYENNVEILNDLPYLLEIHDDLGMNVFLYAVLFYRPDILQLYSKEQLKTILPQENILGHDYLCMAALRGFNTFCTVLKKYDKEYRSEKISNNAKKVFYAANFVHKSFLAGGAKNYIQMHNSSEFSDDATVQENLGRMAQIQTTYQGKADESEKEYVDLTKKIETYKEDRFDQTVDKLQNDFSDLYVEKSQIDDKIRNITKEINDIQNDIIKVEYNRDDLNSAKEELLQQYNDEKMNILNNLQKDEFETTQAFLEKKENLKLYIENTIHNYESQYLQSDIEKRLCSYKDLKQQKIKQLSEEKEHLENIVKIPQLLEVYASITKFLYIKFSTYDADTQKYNFYMTSSINGAFKMNTEAAKNIKKDPETYPINDIVSVQINTDQSIDIIHDIKLNLDDNTYCTKIKHPLMYSKNF